MSLRHLLAGSALILSIHAFAATTNTSAENGRSGADSAASFTEAQKMLGTVPTMLKLMPEAAVPGAWAELRDFQMGKTTLSGKTKELIGLAVSAQIPCRYCLYFHGKAGTELNGVTETEKKEAIAIAALTRHWSTFLNGLRQDEKTFMRDLERMSRSILRQTRTSNSSGTTSGATTSASTGENSMPPMKVVKNADEVYSEAKKMWGFVPDFISKFPKQAVTGAWNQYNGVMYSPSAMIPMKDRILISLAVASQIPCSYCVIMDKQEAKNHGISENEMNEAITMSAMTRHWSTVLNGNMLDEKAFRAETDGIIAHVKKASASSTGTTSGTTSSPEAETSSGTSQSIEDGPAAADDAAPDTASESQESPETSY